jgi:peptidoglycan L-alanyl-D-glutamate endopeptidase CwlK
MSNFTFSQKSLGELQGVHQDLVAVVNRALELTVQDFAVNDGNRTLEEQKKFLAAGTTQTLDSRHLNGHAVDLVPVINGKLKWDWNPIYKIAEAVRAAAKELSIPLRWGGAWDVAFTQTDDNPEDTVEAYSARRRAAGKKVFLDGPHFELPKGQYP